jgi:hypothetical protein
MSTIHLPPMPSWKCHKVVQAAKILRLDAGLHGNVECLLDAGADHDAHEITLPSWWVGKHGPQVGGYLVQYEDGYASYSPAAAFEAGYAPIKTTPTLDDLTRVYAESVDAAMRAPTTTPEKETTQ